MTSTCIPRNPAFNFKSLSGSNDMDNSVMSAKHVLFTSSGRAAIALGLRQLGVSVGDAVLVPSYHCPTMVAPVAELGAHPRFYPITEHGLPDLSRMEKEGLVSAKVMIAAHFFGLTRPMRAVREFCDKWNIALIEDCAHCFFGVSDGQPVGYWGDLAIASLTKFFSSPSGGLLVSQHASLETVHLTSPGAISEFRAVLDVLENAVDAKQFGPAGFPLKLLFRTKRLLRSKQPSSAANHISAEDKARYNAFAFDIEAAKRQPEWIARQLPRYTNHRELIERRRTNYQTLAERLSGHKGFFPLFRELADNDAPYVFPLYVHSPQEKYLALKRKQMPVFRWDWLWPETPQMPGDYGSDWSDHVVQIACHQTLTPDDINMICETIIKICD